MLEILPNWHPLFVHFTVGLLVTTAALLVVALFFPATSSWHQQALIVAHWNLVLGYGFAIATAFTGWLAYNSVTHDDLSHAAMTTHRNWALVTLLVFLPLVLYRIDHHRKSKPLHRMFVGALLLPVTLLVITAWHGGELVYRYGLGVQSLPKTDHVAPAQYPPAPAAAAAQSPLPSPPPLTTQTEPAAQADKAAPKKPGHDGHNHAH